MENINFSHFITCILEDDIQSSLLFFKDQNNQYTYKDFIHSALNKAFELKNLEDQFFALKMQSSYSLFVHLLAGLFSSKKMLILSSKEPINSVNRYQNEFLFTKVLSEDNSPLSSHGKDEKIFIETTNTIAFFILSSGSTGPSKLIPLTIENVYASAKSVIDFFKMDFSDTSFLNLPHHHIGGLMILWRAFFSHGSVSIKADLPYQFISLVPLQLKRMLEQGSEVEKLKKCKGVLIGGAAMGGDLKKNALNYDIPVYETYGMSETCSLVMLNGSPLKNQTIKLDPEGHFLIKGPTLSPSATLDSEGFYHTKDIGVQNLDGSFSFKHRSDLLFKSAGEMINPLEIEAIVKQLPWISSAVIVPVKHPEWSQASTLVYKVNNTDKNQNDIIDFLKKSLHPHLIPRFFYEAPDELLPDGMKPNRFLITSWAQERYFNEKIHSLFISTKSPKKLMVFLHGFMEDHTDMIPLMDNHKDFAFLFIDLPGHGKTSIEKFKNRDEIFFDLINLINFYKLDLDLIIYGYSQGGRIALELALDLKPQLLILESAHFGMITDEEKKVRLKQDKKLFTKSDVNLKDFFSVWYSNPIFGKYNQSPHFASDIEKKLHHSPMEWQKSLGFFSPGAAPYTLSQMTEKIMHQKIIGIVGSDDVKYAKHFKDVKKILEQFEYYTIDSAGHNPHKSHLPQIKRILSSVIHS
jgi:O-succinylbenzoic acid--CoA ligase